MWWSTSLGACMARGAARGGKVGGWEGGEQRVEKAACEVMDAVERRRGDEEREVGEEEAHSPGNADMAQRMGRGRREGGGRLVHTLTTRPELGCGGGLTCE